MLKEYLDINGLTYLWSKLKTKFSSATNWLNGSATGSVRTVRSAEEDSEYTIGLDAVAEGSGTKSSGNGSHSEGLGSVASGNYSHAGGAWTIAQRRSQTTIGEYNVADTVGADEDSRGKYAFIIGNGDENNRSNAFTVDWAGNLNMSGNLSIQDTAMSDFVTNQGNDGTWFWRYWNNGRYEAWTNGSTTAAITTATGGVYTSSSLSRSLPSGIVQIYSASIEPISSSYPVWAAMSGLTTTSISFRLLSSASRSSTSYSIRMYIFGRWKN